MTLAATFLWSAVLALLPVQGPRDPATLGYVPIAAPAKAYESAYGDPAIAGAEEKPWTAKLDEDLDHRYGSIADATNDLSLDGAKTTVQRVTSGVHASSTFSTPNG